MTKKTIIKSSVIVIVICVIAFIGYTLIKGWHAKSLERVKTEEEKAWKGEIDHLSNKIVSLEKEITVLKGLNGSEGQQKGSEADESLDDGFKEKVSTLLPINEIEHRVASFFMYLNEQDYFKEYNLKESAYNEYEISIQKISSTIPIITGETDTLYNLFLNMAHFYRVLGKERLFLIRDILKNEKDKIENLMNALFLWYTYEYDKERKITGRPTLKVLYEYSGFLLNTIGGRNYLLRRDSKVRLLLTYYCVLILDRANDLKLNSHGIDIRPYLNILINEMTNHMDLEYKKDYLNKLKGLIDKYERREI